jgi:HAE1 family hydrophobic/amphiphilic exporter-1
VGDIDANVAKLNQPANAASPSASACRQDARADHGADQARSGCPPRSGGTTTLDSVADVEFQAGPAQASSG